MMRATSKYHINDMNGKPKVDLQTINDGEYYWLYVSTSQYNGKDGTCYCHFLADLHIYASREQLEEFHTALGHHLQALDDELDPTADMTAEEIEHFVKEEIEMINGKLP